MAGTCVHCACTETTPCAGGCAWADPERTICTVCATAAETARELVRVLGITATEATGLRLATARYDLLPLAQQTILVTLCRAMVDAIRDGLLEALHDEATAAIRESDRLSGFLLEHFAAQIGEEETTVDVVTRLLTPQIGKPYVLPGGLHA